MPFRFRFRFPIDAFPPSLELDELEVMPDLDDGLVKWREEL